MRRWLFAILVGLTSAFCWMRSINADFVELDDLDYVYQNEHVRDGLTTANIAWAFTDCGYASNWHPLCWISLMTDVTLLHGVEKIAGVPHGSYFSKRDEWRPHCHRAWTGLTGNLPHLMHAHNLLLHVANTVLLFLLMTQLLSKVSVECRSDQSAVMLPGYFGVSYGLLLAVVLSLLWSVHPLRAEVVCWISERKEVLSVFFMLLALLTWFSGKDEDAIRASAIKYVFSLVFFACALLAKPVAVTLPAVIFASDFVLRRKTFLKSIVRVLPFAGMSAATCVFTMLAQKESIESGKWTSTANRITYIFDGPIVYLRQTFWPRDLSCYYSELDDPHWIGMAFGILLLAAMVWVTIRWLRRHEDWSGEIVFGISWAYIGLLPMLGIVRVANQPHSDRYSYWVGCGAMVLLELLIVRVLPHVEATVARLAGKTRDCPGWLLKSLVVAVLVFSFASQGRISIWHDTIVLFRDAVPKCWEPQVTCAFANHVKRMGPEGRAEAEAALRGAVERNPSAQACANLGNFLVSGRTDIKLNLSTDEKAFPEARYWAQRALELDPNCGLAYATLGCADINSEDYAGAVVNFEKAIKYGEDIPHIERQLPEWRELAQKQKTGKQNGK